MSEKQVDIGTLSRELSARLQTAMTNGWKGNETAKSVVESYLLEEGLIKMATLPVVDAAEQYAEAFRAQQAGGRIKRVWYALVPGPAQHAQLEMEATLAAVHQIFYNQPKKDSS